MVVRREFSHLSEYADAVLYAVNRSGGASPRDDGDGGIMEDLTEVRDLMVRLQAVADLVLGRVERMIADTDASQPKEVGG